MTTIATDDGRWFASADAEQFVSLDGNTLFKVIESPLMRDESATSFRLSGIGNP